MGSQHGQTRCRTSLTAPQFDNAQILGCLRQVPRSPHKREGKQSLSLRTSWDSDEDSRTSTPDFKRGIHVSENATLSVKEPELTDQAVKELQEESKEVMARVAARRKDKDRAVTHLAVMELRRSGPHLGIPPWIASRKWRGHSVLILADSQLDHWPSRDRICSVINRNWPVSRWTHAIRLGEIKVQSFTVVLYLEGTRMWNDVPPMKNTLQALCKAIRNHANQPRIFIANHLPRLSTPIGAPVVNTNFTLQQATRSLCRSMGRVFELSLHEHFTSRKGRIIKPTHKYFLDSTVLTPHGCLIFRECVL